jgi:hypothetical protein
MTKPEKEQAGASPSQLIDARIREPEDWRGELPGRIRKLIKEADPQVVEEWKWRGVPGAALDDPAKLFSSSLDDDALKALIRAAVRLNTSASERRSR